MTKRRTGIRLTRRWRKSNSLVNIRWSAMSSLNAEDRSVIRASRFPTSGRARGVATEAAYLPENDSRRYMPVNGTDAEGNVDAETVAWNRCLGV